MNNLSCYPKVQRLLGFFFQFSISKKNRLQEDMSAINDPLGQTHSPASSDHYSHLKVVLFCEILKSPDGRTDGRTPRAKIVITTGRDCGSASWINRTLQKCLRSYSFFYSNQSHNRLISLFSISIDPPGHSRIGGHYFHTGCTSVRPPVTKIKTRYNANIEPQKTKQRTPCEKIMITYWLGPGGSS